jgi:antimicrobial peptide system SdpB family protein
MRTIEEVGKFAEKYSFDIYNRNTIGIARSLLAISFLITIGLNDIEDIINVNLLSKSATSDFSIFNFSIFSLLINKLWIAKTISIIIMIFVLVGYRPRWFCLPHAYLSFSLSVSGLIIEGGDQVCQNLSLLIVPICLLDNRKWHWQNLGNNDSNKYKNIFACIWYNVIILQIAFIYFHASVGKYKVTEWMDGTAIYYWLKDPLFGFNNGIGSFLIDYLLINPFIVTSITWSVLILELFMAFSFLYNEKMKRFFLFLGILFHFLIAISLGLVSFFFSMFAALILFLGQRQGYNLIKFKVETSK